MMTEEQMRAAIKELTEKQYVTCEMPGALRNGTRVRKVRSEPGDGNRDGSRGTVLGSLQMPDMGNIPTDRGMKVKFLYFIRWDRMSNIAVGVLDTKLEPDKAETVH